MSEVDLGVLSQNSHHTETDVVVASFGFETQTEGCSEWPAHIGPAAAAAGA